MEGQLTNHPLYSVHGIDEIETTGNLIDRHACGGVLQPPDIVKTCHNIVPDIIHQSVGSAANPGPHRQTRKILIRLLAL